MEEWARVLKNVAKAVEAHIEFLSDINCTRVDKGTYKWNSNCGGFKTRGYCFVQGNTYTVHQNSGRELIKILTVTL